jgi:hypothetical protein
MNPARLRDLQASLRRELNRQTQERNLGPAARALWLVDQLNHYVERWLGLCASSFPSVFAPNDDLFQMVEIGAEAVSEQLQSLESPATANSWQRFMAAWAAVRGARDPAAPQQLANALAAVRSALCS